MQRKKDKMISPIKDLVETKRPMVIDRSSKEIVRRCKDWALNNLINFAEKWLRPLETDIKGQSQECSSQWDKGGSNVEQCLYSCSVLWQEDWRKERRNVSEGNTGNDKVVDVMLFALLKWQRKSLLFGISAHDACVFCNTWV